MQNPKLNNLLKRLWKHVSLRRRTQLAILFILIIVVSIAELISIGAIFPFLSILIAPENVFNNSLAKPLIKILGLTQPIELLAPITIFFVMAAMFSGGLRYLLNWAQTRLGYAMGADFSNRIYERTLYQPYMTHLMRNTSEIIAAVTAKADGVIHHTIMPIIRILSSTIILTAVLYVLIMIEPLITVIVITSFSAIYYLITRLTRQVIINNSRIINKQQVLVIKLLQEAFGGIRDVIIEQSQKTYSQMYRVADWQLRNAQSQNTISSASPKYLVETFGIIIISIIAYFLTIKPEGHNTSIPLIGMIALAMQRILPLLQQTYSSWISLLSGQAQLLEALNLLDQHMPNYVNETILNPLEFKHEITLHNVSFRYVKNQPYVLENINLTIKKNCRIGFIGSTGSGKTTLLDILMGLLSPTKGSFQVDGKEIGLENCREWQAQIAHVPQSIFLADTSITENIAFGIPIEEIDKNKIREAALKAQIADLIEEWPDGYETIVGERGIRLSGGQRQRIGIARALYKKAKILIFDEATSSLDSNTEKQVMELINRLDGEVTLLIVAHRLSTLAGCSKVVELSAGKIKRIGTYKEIVGIES